MNVFEEVRAFYMAYRGKKQIIGYSEEGREIFAMLAGTDAGGCGIAQYAIHAREYITALLALEHARLGVRTGGVWIVPLVDPDGALLVEEGPRHLTEEHRALVRSLNGSDDFSLWKANAEGVDLNLNFDARWGSGKGNLRRPAPAGYIGSAPLSASESRALADFTLAVRPKFTVSWHTKGEEIYWEFHRLRMRRRDKKYAEVLSRATGYPLVHLKHSAGGYKDWCIAKRGIPAYTVETGAETASHPLGRKDLVPIIAHDIDALVMLTEAFG